MVFVHLSLPWTLVYSSSNWGLSRKDNELALGYVEEIEKTSRGSDPEGDLSVLLRSMKRPRFPATVKLYPYFTQTGSRKAYTNHPKLSELFIRLEKAGWKREVVYDLFISLATSTEMVEALEGVKRRACRGAVMPLPEAAFHPEGRGFYVLMLEAPPKMLSAEDLKLDQDTEAKREVVDVDVGGDARWVLERGAVIRPKNRKTLVALEELDRDFGLWKFVGEEEDLWEMGRWQYVVL